MEPTTTSDNGASNVINGVPVDNQGVALVAQPDTSAAVSTTSEPVPTAPVVDSAPVQTTTTDEGATQPPAPAAAPPEPAQASTDDLANFAKAKGFDPETLSDGERKALEMARNAEKRMHQATQPSRQLENAVTDNVAIDSGDPKYDDLAQEVVNLKIKANVSDFWVRHPEAKEFEQKMAEIVQSKPWLANDLADLYAVARNDPSRETELRQEGGVEALTDLAQRQQAAAPTSAASNPTNYQTNAITPQNVYDLVQRNDQEWFEKNHTAISRAMEGKA